MNSNNNLFDIVSKEDKNKPDLDCIRSVRIILGIVAGIVIWIAAWQLAELYVNKSSKRTQTIIYGTSIIVAFLVLYWLGKKYPSNIGMA